MLTLLLGRSGSGKSSAIFQKMKTQGTHRPQILIVPEQASFETEYRLCEENGNGASLYAEVFSFTSLEERVLSLAGGLAHPILDPGGRLLLMYVALKAVRPNLSIFGMPSQRPEFLTGLIATMDELKSYCVTPQTLFEIAEELEDLTGKKLKDLALIYGAYDSLTARSALDPRDRLSILAEKLKVFPFAQGKDVYVDGFTDFTPQEEQVLRALLCHGHSITVSLTCDSLEGASDDPFAAARLTALRLKALSQKDHISCREEWLQPKNTGRNVALRHIEKHLFSPASALFQDETEAVAIFRADSEREEVTWAAEQICALVREGKCRYHDIAIGARSLEPYRDLLALVFSRYEIPLFQSAMEPILQKPIFTVITAALDIITGGFAYEDVFRYLKTGLTNLTQEECDLLENYVLLWKIRGSQWTAAQGFRLHPRGYQKEWDDGDRQQLQQLNDIRCKVISPFNALQKVKDENAASYATSLYLLLEEICLAEKLARRADALEQKGEPEKAQEYHQLWEIFCHALEQCAAMLKETPMELDEFSRLIKLLFTQYSVGAIPASLDRVIAGDLPRLSNRPMKALLILGAHDSAIPQLNLETGLLSIHDREMLLDYGVSLSPGLEGQMSREQTAIYKACSQPTNYLSVSWPRVGEESPRRPAAFVERLLALFPGSLLLREDTESIPQYPAYLQMLAMENPLLLERFCALPAAALFHARLERAVHWKRGRLTYDTVKKLYGRKLSVSPSRLDRYKSCHYGYFLQYGLQAKRRKAAGFNAPEYGVFVHFVLESVLREGAGCGGVKQMSNEEVKAATRRAVESYQETVAEHMEAPRFRYLFNRLSALIDLVVENVVEELRNSAFEPLAFELGFGKDKNLSAIEITEQDVTLALSGVVDRVDGWIKDGRLYIKVVDYKTGKKSFDLTDIWNGLSLQLLIYLFTLQEQGHALGWEEVVPAGVFYLPARDVVVSGARDMEEADREALIQKKLRREGLILDDAEVLEAMEETTDGTPRFLPLSRNKAGVLKGNALVSAAQLGQLQRHVETMLKEICVELASGEICADPYWRGEQNNACLYCDFTAACHFEEQLRGESRRLIPSISKEEFWSGLMAKEGEA